MGQFRQILDRFTLAIETQDVDGFSALFTEDGEYDDVFYGVFKGREAIARMLREHFYGNAKDFRWQMDDPVFSNHTGYAHYIFSYTSTMTHSAGRRAVFSGAAQFNLHNGMIRSYREWAYALAGLAQLGAPAELLARQAGRDSERILRAADPAVHRCVAVDPRTPR